MHPPTLPMTHAGCLPNPTQVYKTRLHRKELADDFDEYIMVIDQVIKSGQSCAAFCLSASSPTLCSCTPAQLPPLPSRHRRGAGWTGAQVHQPHQVQSSPEVAGGKTLPHMGPLLGPVGRETQVSAGPAPVCACPSHRSQAPPDLPSVPPPQHQLHHWEGHLGGAVARCRRMPRRGEPESVQGPGQLQREHGRLWLSQLIPITVPPIKLQLYST